VQHDDAASLEAEAKFHLGQAVLLWAPVEAAAVPEPYQSLLVHGSDMTSTLEKFHHEKLHVEVLSRHTQGQGYFRAVVLRLDQSGRRVEFGAIKIMLDLFPFEARQEILRERQPLGRILIESGVAFTSQPREYLRLVSDDFINGTLDLTGPQFLYGRRNALVDPWNQPLAEIMEILPPS
jgi:chorismate-pyruvate lyase